MKRYFQVSLNFLRYRKRIIELEYARMGSAYQLCSRWSQGIFDLRIGLSHSSWDPAGMENWGVAVNIKFLEKDLIWSNLSLPVGLPVTANLSAKIRSWEGNSQILFKNILAVLIDIRLHRNRGTEFKID